MIDSSALVAIVLDEPEAGRLADAIAADATRMILAVNWKVRMVLADYGVETVSFEGRQAQHAYQALRRFGKGRHRAGLNIGDCCAKAAILPKPMWTQWSSERRGGPVPGGVMHNGLAPHGTCAGNPTGTV